MGLRRLVSLGVLGIVGCAAREAPERVERMAARVPTVALPAAKAMLPLTATEAHQTGSAIAVATLGERRIALIADEDAGALRVVDAETLEAHSEASLGGKPSQVVVAADGRAYVTLRDRGKVVALEARNGVDGPLETVAQRDVPAEPVGIATTPKGDTVVVASAWGATLTALAVPELTTRFEAGVAREPRGVTIAADGSAAFVSHAMGSAISRVALDGSGGEGFVPEVTEVALGGIDVTRIHRRVCCFLPISSRSVDGSLQGELRRADVRRPRSSTETTLHSRAMSQGFSVATVGERVFAPMVVVVQGDKPVGGYGTSDSYPAHQPALVALHGDEEPLLRIENAAVPAGRSRSNFEGGHRADGCLLPRAVAGDAARGLVLVACVGTNEVIAYDASPGPLSTTIHGRWKVPAGPAGIAIDSKAGRALVWSQHDRSVSVLSLAEVATIPKQTAQFAVRPKAGAPARTARVDALTDAAPDRLSEQAARGRALFHGAGDARISSDGRACASCHPDGRDDGVTWPTPNGARQTPMLAGRLDDGTAPFGWQGDAKTVAAHLEQTFSRLGGKGLKGPELDDLLAYLREMPTPAAATAQSAKVVERGKELFFSEQVGCSVCHARATGSDGARHEVGGGAEVETPSLRFVSGTAPYFHDGRFSTLRELLHKTKGKMGWNPDMSDADLAALEAYLRTL